MAVTYECRDCNVIDVNPQVLCGPAPVEIRCDFGRSRAEREEAKCAAIRSRAPYTCEICGRSSTEAFLVCQSSQIDGE